MNTMNMDENANLSKIVKEDNIEFVRADDMANGIEDPFNNYWNTFLPMFFERITFLMRKTMNDYVKDYGLNVMHASCLIALRLHDGLTLVKLSNFLDIDLSSANRASKTLLEKKFIYDDRESPRSKKYSLYLTEEGKELAIKIMENTNRTINGYFDGIPREKVLDMRQTLLQVLRNMDPKFSEYIDSSRYANPFYVYMMTYPYVDVGFKDDLYLSRTGNKKQSEL